MTQNKSTTIEATYRIVTPMFCSGADQSTAELRVPSFKGALRFWWRSLMWGQVQDHHELSKEEANLFGSSEQKIGQSRVQVRVAYVSLDKQRDAGGIFEGGRFEGAHYLGYGVIQPFRKGNKTTRQIEVKKGELLRPMIPAGEFTVQARLARISDNQQQQVKDALVLLGTVGGLGSKSRKGFGSLTIKQLNVDGFSQTLAADPAERLVSVLAGRNRSDQVPDWTAWSASDELRLVKVSAETDSALELLDAVGREQVHYRSWGSDKRGKLSEHQTLGHPSEQNFKFDHDLSKHPRPGEHPHRVAFGLPHNYGKRPRYSVEPDKHDRRASPLFIHIDQSNKNVAPVALLPFLPSRFLSDGEKITAFKNDAPIVGDRSLWYPIHGFLDRLISTGQPPANRPGYENFPEGTRWWKKRNENIRAEEVPLG